MLPEFSFPTVMYGIELLLFAFVYALTLMMFSENNLHMEKGKPQPSRITLRHRLFLTRPSRPCDLAAPHHGWDGPAPRAARRCGRWQALYPARPIWARHVSA